MRLRMGISLFSEINRYTLEDAKVELFYHLQIAGGSYERIPMGIFEVSEANRKAKCLEIKAYDYMVRFEKAFTSLESIGNAYDFMVLCSTACEVTLAQDRATIERCRTEPRTCPSILIMILRLTAMCCSMWDRCLAVFS